VLKVAIIGCGKIADAHASQIQRIKGCRIVGVCDREPLMARQLHDRFKVDFYTGDLEELLHVTKPDVVHITTPPDSHFGIAKRCLEAGCHVYVEKPFTLYAHEAEKLIALANERRLKVTAGHDDQATGVDDPERFIHSRDIGPHFGLTPRKYASGEIDRNGSITKAGDGAVREVLVQAALTLLTRVQRWSALKAWGMAVAKRRGLRRAIVAVARKLAIILHRMWADSTMFNWKRETVALA